MKKKDIIDDEYIEFWLSRIFVKDGSFIPLNDEEGEAAEFLISAKYQDPTSIVCPYCGGTDNILCAEKLGGRTISAKDQDGGGPIEVTNHGFRCASCFRKWVMLYTSKDTFVQIGLKDE